MDTFVLQDSSPRRRKGILVARWCFWFLYFAGIYFVVDFVWPRPHSILERVFSAVSLAAILCFVLAKGMIQPAKPQSIAIDGDMIVAKGNGKFHKMFLGDIQTVVETKSNLLRDGGLMVSDKSFFKARFFKDFLWIPAEAPDYGYLKSIVEIRAKASR